MGYFSNGTEGELFEERWCSRCVHSDYREGKDFGDKDNPPCPVWMMHMLYAYDLCNEKDHPGKVMLDSLIPRKTITASDGYPVPVNECAMFHECNGASPGQLALTTSDRSAVASEIEAG